MNHNLTSVRTISYLLLLKVTFLKDFKMPTNVADTAEIVVSGRMIESEARQRCEDSRDDRRHTILAFSELLGKTIAGSVHNAGVQIRDGCRKSLCCCKDYFRPTNVGPCVHQ